MLVEKEVQAVVDSSLESKSKGGHVEVINTFFEEDDDGGFE